MESNGNDFWNNVGEQLAEFKLGDERDRVWLKEDSSLE